jgi:hypothetical protein
MNADQADTDGDGRGDVCDNCIDASNFNQADADGDGIGDACEQPVGGGDNTPSSRAEFWAEYSSSQYAVGTECNDGVDNDGDALIDQNDLGCASPCDSSESAAEYGNRSIC